MRFQHVLVAGSLLAATFAGPAPLRAQSSAADVADDVAGGQDGSVANRVLQLGADEYPARREAERALVELGMSAREGLLAGLRSDDAEVRRDCRRILTGVFEADFQKRVSAFLNDTKGELDHDLPGWARYREIAGEDKDARELFVQMLKTEGGLLESLDADAAEAVKLRLAEVYQMAYRRSSRERQKPSRGTMAALIFAISQPGLKVSETDLLRYNVHSLLGQGDFTTSLQKGPHQKAAQALLSEWIRLPATQTLVALKLRFAVTYKLTEPGLDLALHVLQQRDNAHPSAVAAALGTMGLLGGKAYGALAAKALADKRVCAHRSVTKDGKRVQTEIQIRDVAIAWLVHLTGQDLEAYGQSAARRFVDLLERYPTQVFSYTNLAFDSPEKRDEAFKKWNTWAKDHPLEDPPRTGPRQIERVTGPAIAKVADDLPAAPALPVSAASPLRRLEMADRLQVRDLTRARKLIDQRAYVEATTILGEVLADRGDYCYRAVSSVTLFKQLKAEAENLLGTLPVSGLQAYELQFGPAARRLLELAVEAGDMQAVAGVDRSYFFTPAGAEATFTLATYHRLGGRFTQAAMYFERLHSRSPWADRFEPSLSLQQAVCWHQGGFPEKARTVLAAMHEKYPSAAQTITGDPSASLSTVQQTLFGSGADPAGSARSAQWTFFRGDFTGNGLVEPGMPYLTSTLHEALASDRYLADTVKKLRNEQTVERRTALPTVHPLVVDGAVVFRTPLAIRAVDLETDTLRWEALSLNALWHLVVFGKDDDRKSQATQVLDGLRQRLNGDPSFGTLSSNGRLVFAVEDSGFALGPQYRPAIVRLNGRRQLDAGAMGGFNRLEAYDAATGKLVWTLGGPPGSKQTAVAGGRFTGPPLPLGDQLFAVVDFDVQTLLVAVDAATGSLQQQWLLDTREETATTPSPFNPLAASQKSGRGRGVSPVFDDGLLVCRTPRNRYVAVDLASRAVRWSFEPPTTAAPSRMNIIMLQQRGLADKSQSDRSDQWADAGALLADGRALLTPLGSDEIYCLNLSDGNLLWSAPRDDGLYLAGVSGGCAVVVGRQAMRAHRLEDGQLAWPDGPARLPQGGSPSGRGYLADGRLYVPLTSAEIVTLDLSDGRITSKSQSADGTVPENLVKVGDDVVSVGLTGLRRFETLEARSRRLAAAESTTPAEASLHQGEMLLFEGNLVEALEVLQGVYEATPSPRAAALLGEATVQALRAGLSEAQQVAGEIERSVDDPEIKGRLLERLAVAYWETGMRGAAFDSCLKLVDSGADGEQLVDVTAAHTVRRSRRVQGLLAAILAEASPEERDEFDRNIIERLGGENASRALEFFAFHPAAHAARLSVADELTGKQQALRTELLLRRVSQAGSPAQQAEAEARLAELLRVSGRPLEAARFFARLAGTLKDANCLHGKTGQQLVDALPADDPVRGFLHNTDNWPAGEVAKKVTKRDAKKPQSIPSLTPLFITSDGTHLSPRVSVDIDMQRRKLVGRDAQGVRLWESDLTSDKAVNSFSLQNYFLSEGRTSGHLILAWSGQKVAAFDGLADGKLLWSRDVTRSDPKMIWMAPFARLRMQFGIQGRIRRSQLPQPLIVTPSYVAFQQDRILLALDPLSGETLWIRDDLHRGSDLFGDEQRLIITPPDRDEATVLSAIDGRTLGKRMVPAKTNRLGTYGSSVVVWEENDDATELKLVDPWQQDATWQRQFTAAAQPCLIEGAQVGVFEPEGRFVVIAADTGAVHLETTVDAKPDLKQIYVTRNDDRYILIANGPSPKREGPTITRTPQGHLDVDGRVYAVGAESGRQIWKADVSNQWFRVNHPTQAPVLSFFKRDQKPIPLGNGGWRSDKPTVYIECLDSRTGKQLHNSKTVNSYDQTCALDVDRKAHQVTVETRLETVKLTFAEAE